MDADYVVVCFDGVYDEWLVPLFREIYVMFEVFRLFFIADSAFESVESRLADRHDLLVSYDRFQQRECFFGVEGQAPRVHPDGVELSRFGVELFGGRADDGSVAVVVRVNIGRCFNRDGIVTATAPRVTAQDTFDGQPQTF